MEAESFQSQAASTNWMFFLILEVSYELKEDGRTVS